LVAKRKPLSRNEGQIFVHPPSQDLRVLAGHSTTFCVTLQNESDSAVRITGADINCRCTTSSAFPLTLGPQSRSLVEFEVTSEPDDEWKIRLRLRFYVDPPIATPVAEVVVSVTPQEVSE